MQYLSNLAFRKTLPLQQGAQVQALSADTGQISNASYFTTHIYLFKKLFIFYIFNIEEQYWWGKKMKSESANSANYVI